MPPVRPTTSIAGRPYHRPIRLQTRRHGRHRFDSRLFSPDPQERLAAARAHIGQRKVVRALAERTGEWPPNAPGSLNAWLLLVTTKEPLWRDPLLLWPEGPLTLGEAHQGFFYPDPMGFWSELRRWVVELFRLRQPRWSAVEALTLTTLLPSGGHPERVRRAIEAFDPRLILYLDEAAWNASPLDVEAVSHYIKDPHRPRQVYEGFWAERRDGSVVGRSPQHPAAHNLYRPEDIIGFLRSAPVASPPPPS